MEFKHNQETKYIFHQVLQINLRVIIYKNSICIYDHIAFREFQIDYGKTVVSGTNESCSKWKTQFALMTLKLIEID